MILLIGDGKISSAIRNKFNEKKINYDFISFENFTKKIFKKNNFQTYNKIIFLGYNHYSFILNIITFIIYLIKIRKNKKVLTLYFNTQSILLKKINKNNESLYMLNNFNRYNLSKKIISFILSKFNNQYNEIYLPIVTDLANNQQLFFDTLSSFDKVCLPNNGNNKNFFIKIKSVVDMIFSIVVNKEKLIMNRKYFLYSDNISIIDFLKINNNYRIKAIKNQKFKNCYNLNTLNYYRYSFKKFIFNLITLFYIKIKKRNNKNNLNFYFQKNDYIYLNPEHNKICWLNLEINKSIKNLIFKKI